MRFRTIINQLTFSFSRCDVELYHIRCYASWIKTFVTSHFTFITAKVLHFEWIKDKGRVILSLQLLPIFKPLIKHLLTFSHCALKFHTWTSLRLTVWKHLDGYLFWRPRLALNEITVNLIEVFFIDSSFKLDYCTFYSISHHASDIPYIPHIPWEQWWRSGDSTRLPPMWPGFDSLTDGGE